MSEKGDKLRNLADLTDQTDELEEELTDGTKLAWLASQPISDEHEIATNLSKEFKVSLTEAKKSLNMLPKKYTISGEDIPTLVKQLRNKRRELKGQNKIDFTKSIETLIDAYSDHLHSCVKSIYWVAPYSRPLRGMTLKESDIRKLDEVKDYNSRSKLIDHLCKYWEAELNSRDLGYNAEFSKMQKQMRTSKKKFKALLKSVQLGYSPKKVISEHIVKMVCSDPGITCREIIDSMPYKLQTRSTPQMISKMAKKLDVTIVNEQYFRIPTDIKKNIDAYTAAFIDSDGYITMDKSYNPRVGLVATGNRGKAFMIELHKQLGVGRLHLDQKSPQNTRPVNRLNFYSQDDIRTLLTKCRPHFRMKGPQADLLLELIRIKKGHKKAEWAKPRYAEIFKLMKWNNHSDNRNYDWGKYEVDIENISKYETNCKMSIMDELECISSPIGVVV
jgi:hypothetical protein